MYEPYRACTECGIFHGPTERDQSLEQRDEEGYISEQPGTVAVDNDGDVWLRLNAGWTMLANGAAFTCQEIAAKDSLDQVSANLPESYTPYAPLHIKRIVVPTFTTPEEADAWLEANA